VQGWDKQWPSRILGALPKRSWLKRLRRLGLEVLEPIWRHVQAKSPATQSRWQWTWVWDDSVFHKYGAQLGWLAGGGAASKSACCQALMGCCFWWSLVRVD
jgi:hypothetical protein